MKNATQSEIDKFMEWAFTSPEIYPYLSHSKYISERKERRGDWEGYHLTDNRLSYLLSIDFNRNTSLTFTICLYAKSAIGAGQGILALKEIVKRYRPFAINSSVAISNKKSYEITKKILGDPYGICPLAHWNMLTGKMEDTYEFRKIL